MEDSIYFLGSFREIITEEEHVCPWCKHPILEGVHGTQRPRPNNDGVDILCSVPMIVTYPKLCALITDIDNG